jgi:hypothetical protein
MADGVPMDPIANVEIGSTFRRRLASQRQTGRGTEYIISVYNSLQRGAQRISTYIAVDDYKCDRPRAYCVPNQDH